MFSFYINYNSVSTRLCDIGAKYDTYKSSKRIYAMGERYSYSNTIFYDAIFKNHRDKQLNIAEIGLTDGNSLLMWNEYFINSHIFGFDNNEIIENLSQKIVTNRIHFNNFDYFNTFQNIQFDLIIENRLNNILEQLEFIRYIHLFLKPGGMLIIENVVQNEKIYYENLLPLLKEVFEDYYSVTLSNEREHIKSPNRLLIFVKKGIPIFDNKKKVTFITPSIRPNNLLRIRDGINFDYVNEWRIVYDGKKIKENPYIFKNENNPKIVEEIFEGEGNSGNPQRNHVLNTVKDNYTFIYYLDDDNEVHPDLYRLLRIIDDNYMYTFNQYLFDDIRLLRKGNVFKHQFIDSSQILIDIRLCNHIGWLIDTYEADGVYICENYKFNKHKWIYIDNVLSYTNSILNRK